MHNCFETSDRAIMIYPVTSVLLQDWLNEHSQHARWVAACGFEAQSGKICLIPGDDGALHCVLLGVGDNDDFWIFGGLPMGLPAGVYQIAKQYSVLKTPQCEQNAALAWGLGSYQFLAYRDKSDDQSLAQLQLSDEVDEPLLNDWISSIYLGRDLINTPPNDLTPADLARAVSEVGLEFDAEVNIVGGEALIEAGYPAIYAVGKGSVHAPQFIELCWGDEAHPAVTLVGKGISFDTGGLDLKTSAGMRLMKKDMGGAAHAIVLSRMIMAQALPVRLRLMVCSAENAVSGSAFRPSDVIDSRAGKTIEVTNTDAEGRLVLCDGLAAAAENPPELLIDFATLTGAARVALGSEIAAFMCNDDSLADALNHQGVAQEDPLWRLPLHKNYRSMLDSNIADIANASLTGFAGAITAGLFLQEFVPDDIPWIHFDLMAWNNEAKPGRPHGGEIFALRAVFELIKQRFQ